ncbi:HD-GYP domain-containing protein [Haloimpatiens sp. FM7330]|uniref:HD-GYP domain-containing protein n=1 Tax=Haloimpatiens sp. FM7330 TaxID=3298610 RepID=UPI00362C2D43
MKKISLEEIIRAIAIALDLAEIGSVENTKIIEDITNIDYSQHTFMHHSKRTTYIGLEIAKQLNLNNNSIKQLYVSSLLHDIGAIDSLKRSHNSSYIKQHCLIGSSIVEAFPKLNNISNIILYHHENYDGSGPMELKNSSIPIESQIIRISDLIEVLYDENYSSYVQKQSIINWIKSKANVIFSEEIINAFLEICSKDIFWFNIENVSYIDFILDDTSPNLQIYLNLDEFENIAYIFSKVIDNKSKFTAKHSKEISHLAYKVSKYLGYSEEKCMEMKIAGLLHDIGKLAIPSDILDKNGALTNEEFAIIKSHSYYTNIILGRIKNIDNIKKWASNHHEKLNGKGYPRGLTNEDLCEESKILAVCDIYQALTEDRPYRKGLDNKKAFDIIENMVMEGEISGMAVNSLKNTLKMGNL